MKVGDYVRTDIGEIRKVVRVTDDLYVLDKDVVFAHKDKIKISSPDIIDLIEVGDYVNGYRVAEIETLPTKQKLVVVGYGYDADEISENNIKSILTKEQFESMEYKI